MSVKDVGIRIRVEAELRDSFVKACRAQDRSASEVLRDFMRDFSEKHQSGQGSLFFDAKQNCD